MANIVFRAQEKRVIVKAVVPGQVSDTPEQIRDKLNSLPDGFAYIYNQSSPSTNWIVNHNLGYRPTTELRSAGGLEIFAEIIHVSDNQLQVLSNVSIAGQLRLT
jgi:hypothetical protein